MTSVYHPAFQSLVLPVVLALFGMALLQRLLGTRHAGWGGWLGLLGALAWLPGFDLAPNSGAQKLPWVVLACLGLAAVEIARAGGQRRGRLCWLVALLAWSAAASWLAAGRASALALGAAVVFGGVVLALLAVARDDPWAGQVLPARPAAPAFDGLPGVALVLSSLGLAVLAGRGGSLLLAQLALMLASALAVVCCWAWQKPGPGLQPGLRMSFGLAWLSLGWLWVLAAPSSAAPASVSWLGLESPLAARVARVALLALPVAAVWPLSRWRGLQAGRARWWIMLLAAAPVVLGVSGPEEASMPPRNDTPANPHDPYTTSTWR